MDFHSYFEDSAKKINQQMDNSLTQWSNDVKKLSSKLSPFADSFIAACKDGKRIRGSLVKLGYDISRGSLQADSQQVIQVGVAVEIVHTAILIHDDIIDKSPTRRGQPSLYKALGGDHYGISQALSTGDIGLYLAINLIAAVDLPSQDKIKALGCFSNTIINTGWGEILDMELPHLGKKSTEDMILLYKLKTAQYTIAGPLALGAILGGGNEKLIKAFEEFGENAGIAFQIQDDVLDGEADNSAKDQILEYTAKAKKIIPKITKDKKVKQILNQMVDYLVERTI